MIILKCNTHVYPGTLCVVLDVVLLSVCTLKPISHFHLHRLYLDGEGTLIPPFEMESEPIEGKP